MGYACQIRDLQSKSCPMTPTGYDIIRSWRLLCMSKQLPLSRAHHRREGSTQEMDWNAVSLRHVCSWGFRHYGMVHGQVI